MEGIKYLAGLLLIKTGCVSSEARTRCGVTGGDQMAMPITATMRYPPARYWLQFEGS
jgi:hypothetical protein